MRKGDLKERLNDSHIQRLRRSCRMCEFCGLQPAEFQFYLDWLSRDSFCRTCGLTANAPALLWFEMREAFEASVLKMTLQEWVNNRMQQDF